MISDWLVGALGTIGTAAALLVLAIAYIIWQFNPSINLPAKQEETLAADPEMEEGQLETVPIPGGKTINDIYNENNGEALKSNTNKKDPGLMINKPIQDDDRMEFKVIEKDEPMELIDTRQPSVEKRNRAGYHAWSRSPG